MSLNYTKIRTLGISSLPSLPTIELMFYGNHHVLYSLLRPEVQLVGDGILLRIISSYCGSKNIVDLQSCRKVELRAELSIFN